MDIRFHPISIYWLHLIWLAPALGLLYLYGFHRKRQALQLFARSELLSHLVASVDRGRQIWRIGLVLAGLALIAVSLARPQWGSEVEAIQRRGIDLVVLLDLSKSMLAEDVLPNRLERAKADLRELLDALRGDRVGLVAFAGRSEIRCPLTFDYGFFRHILDELAIGSVALGGTDISGAIHKGLDCFQDDYPNYKALLLITDGEDHESFVKDAVERARKGNVRIYSIGIGDSSEGRRIPIADENGQRRYLQDSSGQEVWSKMNPAILQEAALATGGAYVPAGTSAVDLIKIYQDHIGALEKKELEGYKEARYKDRYQGFLALGLALLALEPLVSTRKKSQP